MRRRGRSDGTVRVTIQRVAQLAAVSTATASRALTRPNTVSDTLRERVEAAVAQLEYIPNQTARALSSLHSGLVGVLVPAIDGTYAEVLEAIHALLNTAGYGMLVATTGGDGDRAIGAAKAMAAREIEGLLLVGTELGGSLGDLLVEWRIRCVLVDAGGGTRTASSVDIGYADGGKTIGAYLLGLGHRSLAFLGGPEKNPWRRAALLQGLQAGLTASGATLLPEGALACGSVDIRAALRLWCATPAPPTALVCADDLVALVALRECAVLGVAVPGQLSIVGCGDLAFARHASPALSTLRIPGPTVGAAAVDELLARLAGGSPSAQSIPIKLVVRHSSGPAPD